MAAQIAFVSAPAAAPTINLSLEQPGLVKVKRDSFSLGAPEFEGDPYSVDGGYGERTVSLTLQATGTYNEAATLFQDVAQQIINGAPGMDGRNWLMFRWSPADPVMFLWTLPSSFDPLDFQNAGAGVWELPLSITCDGYIVGAPVDISSFVVTINPSSGTNRIVVGPSVLGTIQGDAPTPLLLGLTAGLGFTTAASDAYLSSYALSGGLTHALLARNLTELTSGTDTGAPVTAAGTNYIDGDYKACTFATASMQTRLSGTFSTALTPMPGLYRALMRIVTVTTTGGGRVRLDFRLGFNGTIGTMYDAALEYSTQTSELEGWLVDFGVVQLPSAAAELGGVGFGSPASAIGAAPSTTIQAALTVVSGGAPTGYAARFDELYLIPVDTAYGDSRLAIIASGLPFGTGPTVFDGVNDNVRPMIDTGGGPFASAPDIGNLPWVGGLPILRPGVNNYVHWLVEPRSGAATNLTSTFSGRYYPRYVQPRPLAT